MFFVLPYRVKNPPKVFPYATVSLIAANVVTYLMTSDLISITESAAEAGSFAFGVSNPLLFLSSIFLHGDLFHLLGNMLFLWIFGPPVEARLGVGKFLTIYLVTGLVGSMLQAGLDIAFFGVPQEVIGASGCIMGVLGAYWYLFSWSTVCVAYFIWIFVYIRWGVWEVAAAWVIGIYFLIDLFQGTFFGSLGVSGGVASFCHVGGAASGALLCYLLREKRDSQAVSDAKAIQANMGSIALMPLHALETMSEQDPCNPEVIRAMVSPAINMSRMSVVHEAMARAGAEMIDKDPSFAAHYLTSLQGDHSIYKPVHLLRLCGLLERTGQTQQALSIYQIIVNAYPMELDAETALYRMAQCCWNTLKDRQKAERCIGELLHRFPNGSTAPLAKNLQRQMASP